MTATVALTLGFTKKAAHISLEISINVNNLWKFAKQLRIGLVYFMQINGRYVTVRSSCVKEEGLCYFRLFTVWNYIFI